jgi:hypothetical protein
MSVELRHYCRNLKCRSKLPAPIENGVLLQGLLYRLLPHPLPCL